MARLRARSAGEGLLPIEVAGATLGQVDPGAITSVMPYDGQAGAVDAALRGALGVGLPGPGGSEAAGEIRAIWTGRGQAMVLGAPVSVPGAALTDQGDGWTVLRLEGVEAEAVLARLCPVDFRVRAFAEGSVARTLLQHMNVIVLRSGAQRFDIMVFRSMTRTAVHDLRVAMESVAAQKS